MIDTHQLLSGLLMDSKVIGWLGHLPLLPGSQPAVNYSLLLWVNSPTQPSFVNRDSTGWRIIYQSPHFWGLVELCKCRGPGDKWSNGVQFLGCNWTSPSLLMQQVWDWNNTESANYIYLLCICKHQVLNPKTEFTWILLGLRVLDFNGKELEVYLKSLFLRQETTFSPFYFILRLFVRDVVNILDYPPRNPLSQLQISLSALP